jgi:hypothetical protein
MEEVWRESAQDERMDNKIQESVEGAKDEKKGLHQQNPSVIHGATVDLHS